MRPALFTALLFAASCGKGGFSESGVPRCDGVTAGKSIVTFNEGNGKGMVPLATPRVPLLVGELRDAAFDIACLQEVWSAEHAREITDGLLLTEKQTFYFDTSGLRENGRDLCKEEQLGGLVECAGKKCAGAKATEEVSICVQDKCGGYLLGVYRGQDGPACVNCLIAMAGKSIEETRTTCVGEGASRIQGGASSAMLIAKTGRFYNKEPMLLDSSGSNRTALFATVRMTSTFGQEREVEIACMHISASSGKIAPTHSGYTTWEDEKRGQFHAIMEKLGQRALRTDGTKVPTVLMGDFNAGPDSSAEVFREVIAAGFTCPTADPITGGGCSSCDVNSFHGGSGSGGAMIDHVCFLNPPKGDALVPTCIDRLFDKKGVIKDYDGETDIETHPSDHYGKRALFDLRTNGSPF